MYRIISLVLIAIVVWGFLGYEAQAQPVTHLYFGVGGFNSQFDKPQYNYQGNYFDATETITLAEGDNSDTGWQLVYGYQFRKHFAVEGTLFDSGKFEQSGTRQVDDLTLEFINLVTGDTITGQISYGGTAQTSTRIRGVGVTGLAILPVSQQFSLKAKLGLVFLTSASQLRLTGDITDDVVQDLPLDTGTRVSRFEQSETNVPLMFGLEASYKVGWDWGVSLFWHRINDVDGGYLSGDSDLDMAGLTFTMFY